jgi:hypothetical protein
MKPKGKMSSNLNTEVVNSVDDNRKDVKTKCKGSNIYLITKIFKLPRKVVRPMSKKIGILIQVLFTMSLVRKRKWVQTTGA